MRKVLLRYLYYMLGVLTATLTLMVLATSFAGLLFDYRIDAATPVTSELSPIEVLQNILLIFNAGVCFWIASRDRLRRTMALGFASLFAVFLVRELDFFLDFYLVDNLWQVLAALILSVSAVYLIRNRYRFAQGWRRSWPSAGLALIIGGLILLIPYAQLIGHTGLWQEIMGDQFARVVKVAVEEFIELGAYALITIGSIEFLYAWSRLPRTRNIDAKPKRRRNR